MWLSAAGRVGSHGSTGLRFGSRAEIWVRVHVCVPLLVCVSPFSTDPLPAPHLTAVPRDRGTMPGLYVLSSWEALPLKSSRVKACANGYVLSITAQLLYTNPREEPVEGKDGYWGAGTL